MKTTQAGASREAQIRPHDSAVTCAPDPSWSVEKQIQWLNAFSHVLLLNVSERCRRQAAAAADKDVARKLASAEISDYRTIDRVRDLAALHGTDAIRAYLTAAGLMNASNSDEQVYSIAFGTMRSWATDLADLADRLAGAHRICAECRHVYRTPEDLQREWTASAPPDLPARETPPAAEQIYFCPLCQHDF